MDTIYTPRGATGCVFRFQISPHRRCISGWTCADPIILEQVDSGIGEYLYRDPDIQVCIINVVKRFVRNLLPGSCSLYVFSGIVSAFVVFSFGSNRQLLLLCNGRQLSGMTNLLLGKSNDLIINFLQRQLSISGYYYRFV